MWRRTSKCWYLFDVPLSKLLIELFREMFLTVSHQSSHQNLKPDVTGSPDNLYQPSPRLSLTLCISSIV